MRTKTGQVVSTKMDNTVVIRVDRYEAHPIYKKKRRISQKFYAHDTEGKVKEGDTITIYESKPLSKLKRWTTEKPTKASNDKPTE